jgi:hypothetical protein
MIGCSVQGAINKTAFIKLILALALVGVLAAQDTSATLTGMVLGPGDATLPEFDAQLTLEESPRTIFSVRTNSNGMFKFDVLPAGRYTLRLQQPGWKNVTVKSISLGAGEDKRLPVMRVYVAENQCGGGFVDHFELSPVGREDGNLASRVMRDERHPIARATVKLLCDERKVCSETKTDANGDFIFLDLQPEKYFTLRVSHPGFYSLEEQNYEVQAGYDSIYWPIILEHCPQGNCEPRLRPKKPLAVCE